MASDNFRESLQPFCIQVEGFPSDTNESQARQLFQNCLKLEQVPGVQPQQTKWLILFSDRSVADYYVGTKEIHVANIYTLKISPCVLCDIPTSWEKIDLKNFGPAVIPGDPTNTGVPLGQPPHGVYPSYPGYHPSYQNMHYPGFGPSPGAQGYAPPMYPGYPPHYGGTEVPTTMGSKPVASEGTDHIVYPGTSTPSGLPGGHPPQSEVQGQDGKLPGMCGESEVHEQPLVTPAPGTPQTQVPPKDGDQQKQLQPSDGRKSLDNEQGRQENYSSMPVYHGQPYHGPAPGQEAIYSMPLFHAQYAPRFPGPYPPGLPPPYSPYPGKHPGPDSSPMMNQPHYMPSQASPAGQAPGAGDEPSETFKNEATAAETVEEEEADEEEEPLGMIKVTGLPPQTTEESLTDFFESKRKSGGGDIEEMDFQGDSAIITFENPEVVDRVLQKLPLLLDKKQINVKRFVPKKYCSGDEGMKAAETEEVEEEADEEEESLGMIKVTGLPPQTTEESITSFFESKRKSGGGDIEEMDFRGDSAIITFEKPEVVDRVLQRLPLLLNNKQIKVEQFVPEKYSPGAKGETSDPEDVKPSCTIEVRGMNKKTSVDTLELYFGNKKAAGKTVEVVNVNASEKDEGVVYITYETEEVMRAVLARSHKLDEATLEVKEYIPPPPPKPRQMYDDKVLIKGKNPDTTQDGLENFLEAKANVSPKHYLLGEEEDTVLVTFEEPPDFEKLEKACMKKALDKHFLKVYRVPVSNCILVKGTAEKTTQSTLEYYFENTRRSGGGDVTDATVREDGSYLIYFEDHTVIDRVLERSHTVDNQTIDVKLFHELIGDSGEDGPKFKVPDALIISDVDPRKIQFLQHSQPNRDGLEKQLTSQYTRILWPKNLGDPVKLECLLTKEVKDCRTLAKTWKATARSSLDKFLDVLSVFKHAILQEAWSSVMEQLQNMNISHPDGVTVAVEKASFEIFVMGHKKFATDVSQNVEKIITTIADELERKKQQIRETSKILKHHQVMMLSIIHFKETTESKYTGMKVTLDFKARTVTYEGLCGEVTNAKLEMFEILNTMVSSEVSGFNKGKYTYIMEKTVKQYIAGKMKEEKITAVWEMNDNRFLVFAMSDEGAVRAAHILKDSVLETTIDVKKESSSLLTTVLWADEEQNIKAACKVIVYIEKVLQDKPCILIYATDTDAEMVRERVVDFLTMNTVYDTKLTIGTGMLRFLQSHCLDEMKSIEAQHKADQVTIIVDNLGIEIKGTEAGLSKAKMAVSMVIEKVTKKEHILKKPGITKLMTSEDSKPKVSQVEKTHGVIIVPSDESEDDISGAGLTPLRRDGTQEMARCSQPTYNLVVMRGDITNLKVDVLVNAANRELLHNGGLAKAIVEKGGKIIQDDCKEYITQHKPLMEGDVYIGEAGSLSCNYIAHAVGPKWQGGKHREEEHLTEAVLKSLEEANNYQQTSIAFPALGAGVFGYPANKSTRTIVDAIDEFYTDNPRNCIQDVYLCDVNQGNVDLFMKALQDKFGLKKVIISDPSGGARDKWSAPKAKAKKGRKNAVPGADEAPSYPTAPIEINISISLVKGQIANQKVDMIVNTCSKDLKLSNGAVSSSLLAAAGPQMQAECDQNYQGIAFGEIAITGGYNLKCHHVCHGSLPGWDGGAASLVVLQKFMMVCLNEASQRGYESVAFPAMGTGNLGYPRDIVAREMYKIVSKYSMQNPSSPVRNVLFVIYDKDAPTIKAFETVDKSQGMSDGRAGGNRHTRKFGNARQEESGRHHQQVVPQPARHGGDDDYDEVVVDVGSITLKVSLGDITQADSEAIVNGTNSDFDLSRGNVSKVILQRGGPDLKVQVDSLMKEMKKNGIACTTSSPRKTGMPCNFIIHLNVDSTDTNWKKKFLMAMEMADSRSCRSLAFPALGTGIGSKPEQIASAFVEAVVDFENDSPDDLQEVGMVVYQQQMFQKILSTMQMTFQTYKKSKGYMKRFTDYIAGTGSNTKKKGWNPRFNKIPADVSSFAVMVYGKDQRVIDRAINDLEGKLDDTFKRKAIEDDIIKTFTPVQEKELMKLRDTLQIEVTIEKRIGRIQLLGLPDAISNAVDMVHGLMLEVQRRNQAEQEAQLISDMVQWYYIEVTQNGEDLQKYEQSVNRILERGYRDAKNEVEFMDNQKHVYVVDLQSYEEYCKMDPADKVKVIRRCQMTDSTFDPPSNWTEMQTTENMTVVNVPQTSTEFQAVERNFLASLGNPRTVHKIERVQNRTLFQQFVAKKKQMDSQNPKGTQNERMLWHGTAPTTVDSINAHGFNRSYCGKNAVAYGNGVYFAVNSQYSAQPQYSVQDPSGHHRMYQCRVLTGEYTKGQGGMRVPPQKGGQGHILYDSVVDNPNTPSIFVVFHDTQAYPEYIVTFS